MVYIIVDYVNVALKRSANSHKNRSADVYGIILDRRDSGAQFYRWEIAERFMLMLSLLKADHRLDRPKLGLKCICVFMVAACLFLYIAFGETTEFLYKSVILICGLLFLGATLEKDMNPDAKKLLGASVAMTFWFLLLQIKRNAEGGSTYSMELFLSSYLFALPFAFLVKDQHRRWWLKFFAATYLAATVVLAGFSYMLVLECLPKALAEHIYWDGARLIAFRHPNIVACFFMLGVGADLSFLLDAKSRWKKVFFGFLLVILLGAMAYTNSRTTILLTGALLGGSLFFLIFKGKRRQFLSGAVVVVAVILGVYAVLGGLYQKNHDHILEKYTAEYQEQQAESNRQTENNGEGTSEETKEEDLPVYVDPKTGDVALKITSEQGTLASDAWTLNGRTTTWKAAIRAMLESPSILLWGTDAPGGTVSQYLAGYKVFHAHNSWMESLLGLGFPGFVIVILLTVYTLWNCFCTLWKSHTDVWKRNTALLTLCLMAAAFMEPYLFLATMYYHPIDMAFMLCAGYLACWQSRCCEEGPEG